MNQPENSTETPANASRPKLSLLDAACIMVGIIIGASI